MTPVDRKKQSALDRPACGAELEIERRRTGAA